MFSVIRTLCLGVAMTFAFSFHTYAQSSNPLPGQYALVFFHFSECGECHLFAPTMTQFQKATQLPVYDFSFDGQSIPGYATPIPTTPDITNAFFGNIKNAITPATFLINVNTGKYVRLSEGNVTYQALLSSYQAIRDDPATMESMQ